METGVGLQPCNARSSIFSKFRNSLLFLNHMTHIHHKCCDAWDISVKYRTQWLPVLGSLSNLHQICHLAVMMRPWCYWFRKFSTLKLTSRKNPRITTSVEHLNITGRVSGEPNFSRFLSALTLCLNAVPQHCTLTLYLDNVPQYRTSTQYLNTVPQIVPQISTLCLTSYTNVSAELNTSEHWLFFVKIYTYWLGNSIKTIS